MNLRILPYAVFANLCGCFKSQSIVGKTEPEGVRNKRQVAIINPEAFFFRGTFQVFVSLRY